MRRPLELLTALADAPAPVKAALLALGATFFFAMMTTLIRYVSQDLHAFQIVFFRNLFALVWMVPWLMKRGLGVMRTQRIGMYSLRGIISWVAMTASFWAYTLIPLTEATALSFTAPLFATIGAALFLGEVVRLRRWTAIIVGFLGTMIILQPGAQAISLGAALMLGSAVFQATNKLVLKSLAGTENPESIVTYMVLFLTPLSAIPAYFFWREPTLEALLWMGALAGVGTLGHICLSRAYALADVTVVLPFDFGRLPFVAVLGFLVFAEVPTIWTWVGAAVIFSSTFYIARREAQLAKQKRSAAAAAMPAAAED